MHISCQTTSKMTWSLSCLVYVSLFGRIEAYFPIYFAMHTVLKRARFILVRRVNCRKWCDSICTHAYAVCHSPTCILKLLIGARTYSFGFQVLNDDAQGATVPSITRRAVVHGFAAIPNFADFSWPCPTQGFRYGSDKRQMRSWIYECMH